MDFKHAERWHEEERSDTNPRVSRMRHFLSGPYGRRSPIDRRISFALSVRRVADLSQTSSRRARSAVPWDDELRAMVTRANSARRLVNCATDSWLMSMLYECGLIAKRGRDVNDEEGLARADGWGDRRMTKACDIYSKMRISIFGAAPNFNETVVWNENIIVTREEATGEKNKLFTQGGDE